VFSPDPETLIDCLVWYDIGDEETFVYLDHLTKIRNAMHPGSPAATTINSVGS
jgi:hypothetical protein